jgi:hypothetical protein
MDENENRRPRGDRDQRRPRRPDRPPPDPAVVEAIRRVDGEVRNSMDPVRLTGLDAFQRKMIFRHYDRTDEIVIKAVTEAENAVTLKAFPVGKVRRFAETYAQEVLSTGEPRHLPPMGSFERFVTHEYVKNRGGLRSESAGEGADRHVVIFPIFGRTPRKAKRRLTR